MKGYKSFEDTARPRRKYKKGNIFWYGGPTELDESSPYFTELPHDLFIYYPPGSNIYHEVEADGVSPETPGNSKRTASVLRVGARIDISDICRTAVSRFFAKFGFEERIKAATSNTAGDYGAASAGDMGVANTGDKGAANAGNHSAASAGLWGAANVGDYSAASAGNYGAVNAGNCSSANVGIRGAANAGDCGVANANLGGVANAGNCGVANVGRRGASNAGEYGVAIADHYGAASVGKHGIAIVSNGKAKGKKGALLILTERNKNDEIISYAVEKVDGKKIKANTWYKLVNGKLIETE